MNDGRFHFGWIGCGALIAGLLAFGASAGRAGDAAVHWAYQPLASPEPPSFDSAEEERWVRSPVDRFVLRRLVEKGMTPSAELDRRRLLRRVCFDLTGLPPTAGQLEAFLGDSLPGAYERVVDELLASPRYGERWARHWMDLVHFAESHGHDQDRPRENAWPYRDYLIHALNTDKPYARFVEEQLAGDVLFPGDKWAVTATGFMGAGPWDESSLRDIREDSVDREIARYLDRDDIVTTTLSTFASTTVHCARCHDHKFDPVSLSDYYNLQSVFAGVDKADRGYDDDPQVAGRREELTRSLDGLAKQVEGADPVLLEAALHQEIARWAKGITAAAWKVMRPETFEAAQGSTLTLHEDGSLVAGGVRPETEVYTVIGLAGRERVTAVRLEVLSDPALPMNGPGRQDNGNLHLNEFKVSHRGLGGDWIPLELAGASADFDQAGWTSAMAIDGDSKTAWGVYPAIGKPHQVVFAFKQPLEGGEGMRLKFELHQIHGGGHLIGRPRLSLTDGARPLELAPLPAAMADLLSTPEEARSDRQRAELAGYYLRKRWEEELGGLPERRFVYSGNNRFKADGSFKPASAPRRVRVLQRGSISAPGAEAAPAALTCLPELPASLGVGGDSEEGARRVALARWLTDPRNALVWRSIVNRVWQHHFGVGLVDTPNDFGRMGSKPSHPELLDWLALRFLEGGGSLKRLHRLLVTSAAYRQGSEYQSVFAEQDAGNRYLWRMNRRKLDAESLRDAVLMVAGKLDLKIGGPSVKHFVQKPGVHVTPELDYLGFDVDDPANHRRSVYRFVFRTVPDPLMEALDFPDASLLTPQRTESLTPLQALALVNNRFLIRQSEHLAERVRGRAVGGVGEVQVLYELVLGRGPAAEERELVGAYISKHGLANAGRYLLNSNEFIFID